MIHDERIKNLNQKRPAGGSYILYWMQASQRVHYNHALEFAVQKANEHRIPLIVYFGLTNKYLDANERHYQFMLEGLREVQLKLLDRKILMIIRDESPEVGAVRLSNKAFMIICDCGYLQIQRKWRDHVAQHVDCPCIQIESDVVVPVRETSSKEEYSAATLRSKIHKLLPKYLVKLEEHIPHTSSLNLEYNSLNIDDFEKIITRLTIDRNVRPSSIFHGGVNEAEKLLNDFVNNKLDLYPKLRNDPNAHCLSDMSPYLHFGQISPLYITLKILNSGNPYADIYLEELITRRELSMNYVFYNPLYDSFGGLPAWAAKTLIEHKNDLREFNYSLSELEQAKTHDSFWNAAQSEMMRTGKMHGYMRMYWGKKVIEWSSSPEEAFQRCLYLNNKYELDGRDPNSYAGIAWCFGKHDRPWAERPIFGNIRYMNDNGLKRKFDINRYVNEYL